MQRPPCVKKHPRRVSTTSATIALSFVMALTGSPRVSAQVVVFDPSNYSQNILTAARALNQINNQIKSLENQAQMLINGARNLTSLPTSVVGQLTSKINEINGLIVQDATARWDNTYQALKQTLVIQATIASALDQDGQTLRTLMTNSSGAVGALQAQQSGNELLGLQ